MDFSNIDPMKRYGEKTASGEKFSDVVDKLRRNIEDAYREAMQQVTGKVIPLGTGSTLVNEKDSLMQCNVLTQELFSAACMYAVQSLFTLKINFGPNNKPLELNPYESAALAEIASMEFANAARYLSPIFEEQRNKARAEDETFAKQEAEKTESKKSEFESLLSKLFGGEHNDN